MSDNPEVGKQLHNNVSKRLSRNRKDTKDLVNRGVKVKVSRKAYPPLSTTSVRGMRLTPSRHKDLDSLNELSGIIKGIRRRTECFDRQKGEILYELLLYHIASELRDIVIVLNSVHCTVANNCSFIGYDKLITQDLAELKESGTFLKAVCDRLSDTLHLVKRTRCSASQIREMALGHSRSTNRWEPLRQHVVITSVAKFCYLSFPSEIRVVLQHILILLHTMMIAIRRIKNALKSDSEGIASALSKKLKRKKRSQMKRNRPKKRAP